MKGKERVLRSVLVVIILITIFHVVASRFYLYDELWWVDIVMHFLGGLWVVLFSLWTLFFSGFFSFNLKKSKKTFLTVAVSVALIIGIIWEIFEFQTGITFLGPGYWEDTILDLVMDTLGGLVSAFYCLKFYSTSTINNSNNPIEVNV